MQTVQFKVLNTDTQETNVQMQTENKAQNTQNMFTKEMWNYCLKMKNMQQLQE